MDDQLPRVLLLSHRNASPTILARCLWYEFEDLIQQFDRIDILSPGRLHSFDIRYRIASKVAQYGPLALNPGIECLKVEQDYDLFFTVCPFVKDLLYVNQLKGWRERCRTAVCWIDEILLNEMSDVRYFKDIISKFDHVIVSCHQALGTVRRCNVSCDFELCGIDSLLFAPTLTAQQRCIDVMSIGRKSQRFHQQLVSAAESRKLFYYHDTISSAGCPQGLTTLNPKDHRRVLADLIKRSKFFMVETGKFDEPAAAGMEELIGARYFEGAASGSLLLGRKPRHPKFEDYFFWPDAVIQLSEDSAVVDVIAQFESQPHRVYEMRKSNVTNSLLQHDWAYRWEKVLGIANLVPTPELLSRKEDLRNRALVVKNSAL